MDRPDPSVEDLVGHRSHEFRRSDLERLRRALAETIAAIDSALANRPKRIRSDGKAHPIRELLTAFDTAWKVEYHIKYARVAPGKEAKLAKQVLTQITLDSAVLAAGRYLKSRRPRFVEERHPFWLFASSINELRVINHGTGQRKYNQVRTNGSQQN